MKIFAIDPGVSTGLAWFDFDEWDKPATLITRGFREATDYIGSYVDLWKPDLVVCEKFTIAPMKGKTTEGANMAIELIGVSRYFAAEAGIPFEEQRPADAKNFVTDAKLRRIDWYVPGPDHARDALRHLLLAGARHQAFGLETLLQSA